MEAQTFVQELISKIQWNEWITAAGSFAGKIVLALVLVWLGFKVGAVVDKLVKNSLTKARVDQALTGFVGTLAKWAIVAMLTISACGVVGIETASFAALIAAMGLAIGLSFQGTLSNFASGVMILILRPFKIGNFIKVDGVSGTVREIGIFSIEMDTPDNRRLTLPNSRVFGNTIENVSHHPIRRVDVKVGVSYDADIDTTQSQLLEAVKGVPGVILQDSDHPPAAVLDNLGGSSVDWVVRAWCMSEDFWAVKSALTRAVKLTLESANIGIPYPHLTLDLPSRKAEERFFN